ncbi:MAG: ATP phosphoribosyltransferase regulatory subunit, partial [Nanoarchaeota archaeon]
MTTEPVKGFRDIEDASKRNAIRKVIENTFALYNFRSVEMPLLEYEEFVRGTNADDEAVSSIFKLKDRGERNLALRYELTFQYKRLAQNKKLPYKIYQIGTVFRDEPISGNRWRQFTQCDADVVGATLPDIAELLNIASEIFKKLNITPVIFINNRNLLNEILEELAIAEKDRKQVIREIDKLDKLSEKEVLENLKKYKAEKIISVLKKPENYFEKYESYRDIKILKKLCGLYGVKIKFSPSLARGLSYYNWIIFEIKSSLKETVAGGGSYLLNGAQSSGVSFGLDRLELLATIENKNKRVLVISLDQDKKSIELAGK